MRYFLCVFMLLGLAACGKKSSKEPNAYDRSGELKERYVVRLAEAKAKASKEGWLTAGDCDGMLWAGMYSCGGGKVNVAAAEYNDEPGRFNRRPQPFCGPADGSSQTTWSRDMGMGLLSHAWCQGDLETLKRHASYGVKKNWEMGTPLADGRAVYTPSLIGMLYQTIYALGGEDSPNRIWPSIYSEGLDDYQAHLQMLDVWLRGEVAEHLKDYGAVPKKPAEGMQLLEVSNVMYLRIKEHAKREPMCPFYQYLRGVYDGSLDLAVDLLLAYDGPKCSYVRGDNLEGVERSEWLFAARLVLARYGLLK